MNEDRNYWIELYKVPGTSEKDKAELEERLWQGTTTAERQAAIERRSWLAAMLDTTHSAVSYRQSVNNLGEEGSPLWDRIAEKKLTLSSAAKIAYQARRKHHHGRIPLGDAVHLALKEYDARPMVAVMDGVEVRRNAPRMRGAPKPGAPIAPDATLFDAVRAAALPLVQLRLATVETPVAERLQREFERDLKILLTELTGKIYRETKNTTTSAQTISESSLWRNVQHACDILAIDVPKRGKPVDLKQAHARKWALARAYHPDSNGGVSTEATQQKFNAVLEAYVQLENYNQSLSEER